MTQQAGEKGLGYAGVETVEVKLLLYHINVDDAVTSYRILVLSRRGNVSFWTHWIK